MDGRNGLLTLAAYLTVAMFVALVAALGVYKYTADARIAALQPIESETPPEWAVPRVDPAASAANEVKRRRTADMEKQRIRLLESMLEERTQRLRHLTASLDEKTAELDELRLRYDETVVLAVETLAHQPAGEATSSDQQPEDPKADPAVLEAELSVAREVHQSLVADVTSLQEELARAQRELGQLRLVQDQETMDRLREAAVLENAAASVLLRVGRDAVPALIETLDHPTPSVRRWAATVLGGLGDDAEDALAALVESRADPDPDVRAAIESAIQAIGR